MRRKLLPFVLLLLVAAQGCAVFKAPPMGQAQYRWMEKRGEPQLSAPDQTMARANREAREAEPAWAQPGPEVHADNGPARPTTRKEDRSREPVPFAPCVEPATAAQDTGDYYSEQFRHVNAKAVVAAPVGVATVVTGIGLHSIPILLVGGVIAFTLGLVASRQCRDRGDKGKGWALVGMILGAAALFLGLMVLLRTA